jgi:hypothetical protein
MPRIILCFCSDYTWLFFFVTGKQQRDPSPWTHTHTRPGAQGPVRGVQYQLLTLKTSPWRTVSTADTGDLAEANSINCWYWRPGCSVQYQVLTLKTRLRRTVSTADHDDQSMAYSINCWHWRPGCSVQYQLLTLHCEDQAAAYSINCWHWRPVPVVQYQLLTLETSPWRRVSTADAGDQSMAHQYQQYQVLILETRVRCI